MRIAILSGGDGWHVRDLQRAATALGHQATPVDFRQVSARVPSGHPCGELADFDGVIVRTMPPGSLEQVVFRMDVLQALEARRIPVLNPSRALETCVDKYLALERLRQHGLPVPETMVCQQADAAMAAFEQLGRDVVVKPIFGSEGRGLMRITDPELAWRTFRTIERTDAVLYLQQFISHPGWDLRAFVLNGQVIAAMRRTARGDWRTNVAQGAKAEVITLGSELTKLALDAAKAVGTIAAGVDLLPGPDGAWYVVEVNAVPGWKSLAPTTGVDVAALMVKVLAGVGDGNGGKSQEPPLTPPQTRGGTEPAVGYGGDLLRERPPLTPPQPRGGTEPATGDEWLISRVAPASDQTPLPRPDFLPPLSEGGPGGGAADVNPSLSSNNPSSEFQISTACMWEVLARKAGNVHPGASFRDMTYLDFLKSGMAIAPVLGNAVGRPLGETILEAVRATRRLVSCNTNLGIVLLLAPLAAVPETDDLRAGLTRVLDATTVRDSADVYEAIRLAVPGGLGEAPDQDVRKEPTLPFRKVMAMAASYDQIAAEYANGFLTIFQLGVPILREGLESHGRLERAIQHLQLRWLATHEDTLISRKRGPVIARETSARAKSVLENGGPGSPAYAEFDRWLREDGHARNPGTTADLITACLYVALRQRTLTVDTPW